MQVRAFRQRGKKQTLEWRIWVDGATIHMKSGVVDGRMKHTWTTVKGKGKGRAATTPEEQASKEALAHIEKKIKFLGYREVDPDTGNYIADDEISQNIAEGKINFKNPAKNGGSLRFFKCRKTKKNQREIDEVMALERTGRLEKTVKRDGINHIIFIDSGREPHIFTRRMEPCTDKFPYITKELKLLKLPPETIIIAEFVVTKNGRDNRNLIQGLSKSLAPRAKQLQENPFNRPLAIILGFPFWAGKPIMTTMQVNEWMDHLMDKAPCGEYVRPMNIVFGTLDDCMESVRENREEGLVVYDTNAVFGDAVYNFRGREERPRAWKWKDLLEDDFVMVWDPKSENYEIGGGYGKGRRKHLPGQVALYQYDDTGVLHYICLCGSGFNEEQLKEIADTAMDNDGVAGVGIIEHENRSFKAMGDDSNALIIPIFQGWHADKVPEECVEPRLRSQTR